MNKKKNSKDQKKDILKVPKDFSIYLLISKGNRITL